MWYKLSEEVLKLQITDSAKIIYTILQNMNSSYEEIKVSRKTLSERAGVSLRTVSNALEELEKKQLVSRYRTGRASYYNVFSIESAKKAQIRADTLNCANTETG